MSENITIEEMLDLVERYQSLVTRATECFCFCYDNSTTWKTRLKRPHIKDVDFRNDRVLVETENYSHGDTDFEMFVFPMEWLVITDDEVLKQLKIVDEKYQEEQETKKLEREINQAKEQKEKDLKLLTALKEKYEGTTV